MKIGVSDGARTRGHKGHNLVLYQLSYAHHVNPNPIIKMKHQKSEIVVNNTLKS